MTSVDLYQYASKGKLMHDILNYLNVFVFHIFIFFELTFLTNCIPTSNEDVVDFSYPKYFDTSKTFILLTYLLFLIIDIQNKNTYNIC